MDSTGEPPPVSLTILLVSLFSVRTKPLRSKVLFRMLIDLLLRGAHENKAVSALSPPLFRFCSFLRRVYYLRTFFCLSFRYVVVTQTNHWVTEQALFPPSQYGPCILFFCRENASALPSVADLCFSPPPRCSGTHRTTMLVHCRRGFAHTCCIEPIRQVLVRFSFLLRIRFFVCVC